MSGELERPSDPETLFSQFLEEAWTTLPILLARLPRGKQLEYLQKTLGIKGMPIFIKNGWGES